MSCECEQCVNVCARMCVLGRVVGRRARIVSRVEGVCWGRVFGLMARAPLLSSQHAPQAPRSAFSMKPCVACRESLEASLLQACARAEAVEGDLRAVRAQLEAEGAAAKVGE